MTGMKNDNRQGSEKPMMGKIYEVFNGDQRNVNRMYRRETMPQTKLSTIEKGLIFTARILQFHPKGSTSEKR
jgi:hypothetical protein